MITILEQINKLYVLSLVKIDSVVPEKNFNTDFLSVEHQKTFLLLEIRFNL